MPAPLAVGVLVATLLVLSLLVPFALHRLLLLHRAGHVPGDAIRRWRGELPAVTVQLPVFNEADVVERLIDAAAALDYPAERLEIQVLDDSTDETSALAAARVAQWRRMGICIEHVRRGSRQGFKAGALAEGLARARGELVLVLDADFVPAPDLLRRLLPPFQDPGVGMVQARWDHLNEDARPLTRCQALLLDAHFFLEQGGRYAARCFLNFNGTAGMWRREALESAGGWSADTLTEDLDVSYRAQMAGWRFVFLEDVGVSAELPERIRALEVQQMRWAQGGVQTGRKLLGAIWRGPWQTRIKVEATVHLMGHLAHPLTVALGVLLFPSAVARRSLGLAHFLPLDLAVFAMATVSFLVFYTVAGRRRARPWRRLLPTAALTLALGIGLTASVSRAVIRGLGGGSGDPFHRTPKRGRAERVRYRSPDAAGDTALKLTLVGWMGVCVVAAALAGYHHSLPFLVLFGSAWAWTGVGELIERPGAPSGAPAGRGAPVEAGGIPA